MKRWLIGLVLLSLVIGCTYVFIPDKLKVSNTIVINSNQQSVFRFLSEKKNWEKWWPGKIVETGINKPVLLYNEYDFKINQILHNAFEINFKKNNSYTTSLLQIFSTSVDNIQIQWSAELIGGANPLRRISQYFAAKKINSHFGDILIVLKKHLSSLKNIYGIDIKKEKIQIQLVASTKQLFSNYPTTQNIYSMIEKLKNYLHEKGAKAESFPMLNVQYIDTKNYVVQVALPVDKKIIEGSNISLKWMVKGSNVLTGEVIGGIKNIADSMKEFDKYISDYQRSVIAMPFQLLITDRLKEPDTTKWITRLYYPVV